MFTIAIIGRPNVGKSTLFNRLVGKKTALVDDVPGLTRDRKEGVASIGDISFMLIDTAGLEHAENDSLEKLMMNQTEIAMDDADIILMMIDGRKGVVVTDEFFITAIRKKNKPVILVVNKCESAKSSFGITESYQLGIGEPVAISAEHGLGMDSLYEAITSSDLVKHKNNSENKQDNVNLQIAIAGRPNVGKSTMFNNLLGEQRSIASDIAGTTRDSIYVDWNFNGTHIKLVDTAGLRKRAKRHNSLEKLSVNDSFKAIQYANVVVLLIDATQALDKMDLTLADHIMKEGRGMIIAVNKWDLIENKKEVLDEIKLKLEYSLAQAKGVPVVTLSALNGVNVKKVMKKSLEIFDLWNTRISTGKLNRWLAMAIERHIPPLSGGKRIKLRYITQVKSRPPTFALFTTSNVKDLPESYIRYLMNSVREEFGFHGVPIRILLRKGKNPYEK